MIWVMTVPVREQDPFATSSYKLSCRGNILATSPQQNFHTNLNNLRFKVHISGLLQLLSLDA